MSKKENFYTLVYEKNSKDIKDPNRAHSCDSGMDIFSPETFKLSSLERKTINTGIKFNIPQHKEFTIELQVRPKSGMSAKGLEVSLGTIDNQYTGNVHVTIVNFSNVDVLIERGQKIAQIVMAPVITNFHLFAGKVEESPTRGSGGLGSTGAF